jgi:nicotinamidase-related amidase
VKVLLVIDMIKGFIDSKTSAGECALHIEGASSIITNINREILRLDDNDLLVFVCDEHEEDDEEFSVFPKHCITGTEECEIADGFVQRPHVRLKKTRFSAYFGTELDALLSKHDDIEEIIVTGVCTDICVFTTALDARYRDYKVTIPSDCVYPLDKERGKYLLNYLKEVAGVNIIMQ